MRGRRVPAAVAAVCIGLVGPVGPPPAATSPRTPCVPDPARVVAGRATPESVSAWPPPEVVSKLDTAAQASFRLSAAPGAIVGVRTPQGTWTEAYGVADPATGQAMTTQMHTRIGSVTKTFTTTLLLQLAQQGRLSLNDPVDRYYPGIPNGDRITLARLADMTSGIASYYTDAFLERYFADPKEPFTPDELIAYGVSVSPLFEPGEMFNYSNTNTILLGKVIEKVTGRPVQEALRQNILEPLNLNGTSLPDTSPELPEPHSHGYTLQGAKNEGRPRDATEWNPSFGWTAGGMISDLADLLAYARALGTGQGLLSAASQTARLDSFPAPAGYGLGIGCVDGWVGHTGELPGFNTTVYYDTLTDTSVVVIANSDISSGGCPESPTLADNPADVPCSSPATRIFVALSEALGHGFQPPTTR